jgi:hypothetical protein
MGLIPIPMPKRPKDTIPHDHDRKYDPASATLVRFGFSKRPDPPHEVSDLLFDFINLSVAARTTPIINNTETGFAANNKQDRKQRLCTQIDIVKPQTQQYRTQNDDRGETTHLPYHPINTWSLKRSVFVLWLCHRCGLYHNRLTGTVKR